MRSIHMRGTLPQDDLPPALPCQALWFALTGSLAQGPARVTLCAFVALMDQARVVHASYSAIAALANAPEKSVRKSIKLLVDLGDISILAPGHGRAPRTYRVNVGEQRLSA